MGSRVLCCLFGYSIQQQIYNIFEPISTLTLNSARAVSDVHIKSKEQSSYMFVSPLRFALKCVIVIF